MELTLQEMKNYLRVDFDEDDELISSFINFSKSLCMSIARINDEKEFNERFNEFKIAMLYSVGYLYEHREEANHHELTITLRSLLFGIRKAEF